MNIHKNTRDKIQLHFVGHINEIIIKLAQMGVATNVH